MEIKILASSSGGNAYRIDDGQTPLLLDAGIPFKELSRRLNFRVSSLAGVLISHSHKDHCKAVPGLLSAGIDCYMSKQTADEMGVSSHRVKIIEPKRQIHIGTWTVLPFELEHDVFNLGYLLASGSEKLVYLTDTYYCRYLFSGLTYIMIECNHSYDILNANVESGVLPSEMKKRLIKSHFSLENVRKFLKSNDLSQVQEIHLIHLSSGNSDADLFKKQIMAITGKPVYIAGE